MKTARTQWIASGSLLLGLTACVPDSQLTLPSGFQNTSGAGAPYSNPGGGNSDPDDPGSTGESGYYDGGGDPGNLDGGFVAPLNLLFCGETGQIVLKKGQTTLLSWAYPGDYVPPVGLSFTLESEASAADRGTITAVSVLSALYQAPAAIPEGFEVKVRATLGDATTPSVCTIRLMADEELGIEDDGQTRGAVGNVYVLPINQPRLPDFTSMTPVSSILVPNFDVPQRAFSLGFPGVPDLFEWFGITFAGRLIVPESGIYQMRITSDDGSILWIDGAKIIDNDGVHAPVTVTNSVTLTAGNHDFQLHYYQGPRYLIALEWYWKKPGDTAFSIIPPDSLLRPSP